MSCGSLEIAPDRTGQASEWLRMDAIWGLPGRPGSRAPSRSSLDSGPLAWGRADRGGACRPAPGRGRCHLRPRPRLLVARHAASGPALRTDARPGRRGGPGHLVGGGRRAESRFEGRSSLKTWVFRILLNKAQRLGGRERRTVPWSSLTADDEGRTVDPARFKGRTSPTRALARSGLSPGLTRRLRRWPASCDSAPAAVAELPERQRVVLARGTSRATTRRKSARYWTSRRPTSASCCTGPAPRPPAQPGQVSRPPRGCRCPAPGVGRARTRASIISWRSPATASPRSPPGRSRR